MNLPSAAPANTVSPFGLKAIFVRSAGKEQISLLWEDSVLNHFVWEIKTTISFGDNVNIQAKTWHDFTGEIGVASLEYSDVYEIKDGKIIT